MKTHQCKITEISLFNNEPCLRLAGSAVFHARPGQFLQAFGEDTGELLPGLIYPCGNDLKDSLYCGMILKGWQPGSEIRVRGPRGNGFRLPPLARHVALAAQNPFCVNRLLPLAELALGNGAAVTLFTDSTPSQLAPEIEVLAHSELGQIKGWADYAAAILHPDQLAEFNRSLDLIPGKALPFIAEIMLDTPMICDENSTCGVCAVLTNKGWKYACKDGPVFCFEELMIEEQTHG